MTDGLPVLDWRAFRQHKRGNAAEDYEDAFAGDPATGRFAVADGASEASFAGPWARALAEAFVSTPGKPWQQLDWLAPPRKKWATQVDALALPWYAESKRDDGAFATLLGLVLQPPRGDGPGAWRALAVGDACLFHVRNDRFLTSFPLTGAAEFGNSPRLVCSRAMAGREAEYETARGRWRPEDRFLLMTDALAQWFLEQADRGREPITTIACLLAETDPEAAFPAWVEERRKADGLRNDDVTLLVIDIKGTAP